MTTLLAAAEVKLDGQALEPGVAARVLEVRVELQSRLPARCTVRIADPELELVDTDSFPLGGELEVLMASPGETTPASVFKGQVATLEPEFDRHEALLVVRAYDRAHRLTRTRRTDTFQQMSYSDIARTLASRCSLTAGTIDGAGGALPFFQQSNETDWELLWRMADEVGFEVYVEDRALNFRKAGTTSGSAVELTWGDNLLELRPRVTGVQQADSVEVRGWDPKTKEPIVATATPATTAASIGIERSSASGPLGGGKVVIADVPVQTDAHATKLAESVAAQLADAFVEADGVAIGDPQLKPHRKIDVEGVGERFGGTYTLTSVTHVVRAGRGYETRFAVTGHTSRSLLDLASGTQRQQWGHAVVVGLVTNNQDPDALGRVRVSYPTLGSDHEGWWARVTAPAAGTKRGVLMLPQVGDEVLLAFEHGDTEHPYVLGSVWNGTAKPETLVHQDGSFALRSDKKVAIEAADAITVDGDKTLKLSSAGTATITTSERSGDGPPGDVLVDAKGKGSFKTGAGELALDGATEVKVTGKTAVKLSAGAGQVNVEVAEVKITGARITISGTAMVQISGPQIMLG